MPLPWGAMVGADLVDGRCVDLFEAVVLSELLSSRKARRVLLSEGTASAGPGDQTGLPNPAELAIRVRERAAALGSELAQAERASEMHLRESAARGFEALTFGDVEYPDRLAQISDPPPVLWIVGTRRVLQVLSVALVGSRAGSGYACEVAESLASGLSARGVAVVSGLARGVDGAAHRVGLTGPGGTIGVLGCGLDVAYPPEHKALMQQMKSSGAIISEFGPAEPPRKFHFPRRNRIISGISVAVVVIEAAVRSGSLITARCAADQGRDVTAVPGSVLTGRNRGGHGLMKDGAKVVETADDILEEIGMAGFGACPNAPGHLHLGPPDLLLRQMDAGESYDLDDLSTISGLKSRELMSKLVALELEGLVRRSEVGRYRRLPG